ncbi:hypothetical protein NUU61_009154 [Penicillium alfredii]|uniref:A to I editase domain-containing protein n=1 Tax=Penicillium alfredii TaxID=1506179 RepID=A0A9W9EMP6_9EURO|nr:uncharacterized protein NUU61_009154 [Penicillium alfredii]KAJ5084575.1 hypothetical protein NUU61_009154 [Penicillium alfredii]
MSELGPIPPLPSRIAALVHAHFDALPTRSKPTIFPDGSREWIPMTGIVIVKGENTPSESLTCIAVTSGAKCLPASHIPRCRGLVLHDCHAEILAIRAFNYWLLTECYGFLSKERQQMTSPHLNTGSGLNHISESPFIRRRNIEKASHASSSLAIDWPPFEFQPDVTVYMYCTCAPCGDASMELCMAAQEDATPWEVLRQPDPNSTDLEKGEEKSPVLLDGRAHFSLLGVVRRKPARMDAESTRSKSCSDKLALRQVSSLLSAETSRFVAPTGNAYLAGLILPEAEISRAACERCFGETGRMQALTGRSWPTSPEENAQKTAYRFHPFRVLSVPAEEIQALWRFAKPKPIPTCPASSASEQQGDTTPTQKKSKPGNVSAVWTVAPSFSHPSATVPDPGSKSLPALRRSKTGLYETIINGVKQGNRATSPLARGASALCRAKLWALVQEMVQYLASDDAQVDARAEDHPAECVEPDMSQNSMLQHIHRAATYSEFKNTPSDIFNPIRVRVQAIEDAKKVLEGWIPNSGDEGWGLEVLVDPKKRKR